VFSIKVGTGYSTMLNAALLNNDQIWLYWTESLKQHNHF